MRVALYARVSTTEQTVAPQLDSLRAYATARRLEVIEEYVDHGVSGSRTGRRKTATRPCWSKGSGGCDDFMKLRLSSSGCEARPARGEPARAGSEPGDGHGNGAGEA